ncbi:hypothetical protein H1Z61_06030 [Bacillus aquiflavi]|uniref:Uncharacterized protein n=1 Tax=Bacillus aquiflavi TaxID=2672567 RepID=A0A6B3VZP3_9BACI|nr:hypothetical protein [Bacillus aquiflavi]MBA4536714.1 hypothetical protein [Bacillus aquiflavi]NEY81081.1 hypothetical protein [Bacillus aquiflavi]UAC48747.1 hypothetical protein K6959_01880 [Bacillus aquiflavi]
MWKMKQYFQRQYLKQMGFENACQLKHEHEADTNRTIVYKFVLTVFSGSMVPAPTFFMI